MTSHMLTRSLDRGATAFLAIVAACGILIPLSNLLLPEGALLHVPTYLVALWGKYVCYALLALAIDLIWGYCGILSLGHGAFFALGGYAMGMYLMRQIGSRGVYAYMWMAGLAPRTNSLAAHVIDRGRPGPPSSAGSPRRSQPPSTSAA